MFTDKMRSGESLATYIVLGALHGYTLDAMQRCESQQLQMTLRRDLVTCLSYFAYQCINSHYLPPSLVENMRFFFSIETITGRYIKYRIFNSVSHILELCHSGMVVIQ